MHFFASLFSLALFFSSSVFAVENKQKPNKSLKSVNGNKASVCSKQLANILYYPQVPAFSYLETINADFQVYAGDILGQVKLNNYRPLSQFMKKWGCVFGLYDGFSNYWIYFSLGPNGLAIPAQKSISFHSQAQAVVTGTSFGFSPDYDQYEMTSAYFGDDGLLSFVTIGIPSGTFLPSC